MMKKILSILIALLLLLSQVSVFADNAITISLDGKALEIPVEPQNVSGSIMVPFRPIFEAFGMEINWSDVHQKVLAQSEGKTIILTIGSDKMLVNTDVIELPVTPFIQDGSTLVPVRAVAEALECTVGWDDATQTVIIKSKDYVEPETTPEEGTENVPSEGTETDDPISQTPVVEPLYTPTIDTTPAYINKTNDNISKELMNLINTKRTDLGIPSLTIDKDVCAVALSHSQDMATKGYFSHTTPEDLTPFDRLDKNGITYTVAAENLASGFATPKEVLDSWMNSQSHKEIILSNEFNHIGVGYYAGGPNGTYWTLVLINK